MKFCQKLLSFGYNNTAHFLKEKTTEEFMFPHFHSMNRSSSSNHKIVEGISTGTKSNLFISWSSFKSEIEHPAMSREVTYSPI